SSRRRHTSSKRDWSSDVCSSDLFDDVWTKEVFANYFASQMTRPEFPGVNHLLNDLRNFYIPAYAEDRTAGSTSIKQPLENLKDEIGRASCRERGQHNIYDGDVQR